MRMTPAQSTVLSSSRSALISGTASAVESIDRYLEDFDITLAEAISEALEPLRSEIRFDAKRDPEWSAYADYVTVDFWDGQFHYFVDGPDDIVQQAMDLEYGTSDRPPNSLLRKYAQRNNQPLGMRLTNMLAVDVV
jgi:hypothetical protein